MCLHGGMNSTVCRLVLSYLFTTIPQFHNMLHINSPYRPKQTNQLGSVLCFGESPEVVKITFTKWQRRDHRGRLSLLLYVLNTHAQTLPPPFSFNDDTVKLGLISSLREKIKPMSRCDAYKMMVPACQHYERPPG